MTLPGIKAVLLDVDGTLVDSNDQQARAWLKALGEAQFHLEYAAVRSLIGKGGDKMTQELCGLSPDDPLAQRIAKRVAEVFEAEFLESVQPTKGARELLDRLRHSGLRLVVATSAGGDSLEGLLRQANVHDLIDDTATSGDVDASKPDPDLMVAALTKAGVTANQAVMLGDTPYDVWAAHSAGVRTIALRCGGWWSDADFAGAVAIFDDPASMLAKLGHLLTPIKLQA